MLYKDQLVLTGAIDDVGSRVRANSDKSYRLGLEIDATIKVSNQFSLQPNVAISSNKNIDFITLVDGELRNLGNTNLSFSPSVVAGNAFTFQPTKNLQLTPFREGDISFVTHGHTRIMGEVPDFEV